MSSVDRIELPCENRALVFEHDAFHAQVLKSLIEPYGLIVTECSDIDAAIQKAGQQWHPFVFISDVQNSETEVEKAHDSQMDHGFVKKLREMPAYENSMVILVGAEGEPCEVIKAIESGVDLFLSKPIDADALSIVMATSQRLLRERLGKTKLEGRLRDREKNYSEMLSVIPDIVYQIDLDGRFIYVNQAVSQLGYEPQELLGQNFSILFDEDEYKRICRDYVLEKIYVGGDFPEIPPKLFDERRTGRRRTEHLEVKLCHRDGGVLAKAVSSFGDICSQGYYDDNVQRQGMQVMGTIGVIHDMTKYKELEGRLDGVLLDLESKNSKIAELEQCFAEDKELLEKQNKMFESFAYRVAHDLRSPLSFLRSLVDLYRGEELDRANFITRLERGLSSTVSMVNGLYNLGRMHQRDHVWGVLSLKDVIEETCEWLSLEVNAKGVEVQSRDLVDVMGIEDILPLVFLNLMSNAIKYNHADSPKVLIYTERHGEEVKVYVEDNGAGIPQASQKVIFEAFSQLDHQNVKEGLGVGLNTVRNALELHHSRIEVGSSRELGGASFAFYLKAQS